MKARLLALVAFLLAVVAPASAHRIDEYLQATLIAVEKDRVTADMYLTPGVAVLPTVLAAIDTDQNGLISEAEQRAYAARVLDDLSLTVDGARMSLRLVSLTFPRLDEMKEGRGDIHLELTAYLPPGGAARKLRLENRHQPQISACQVNCLVPRDPKLQITAQHRNESQSIYELDWSW